MVLSSLKKRMQQFLRALRPTTSPLRVRNRYRPRGESLEDRVTPATLYVDNAAAGNVITGVTCGDFTVTDDQGTIGILDLGDEVTWNPGAGSAHGGPVTNLEFGTQAFSSIQSAITFATATDTIRVAPGEFAENLIVGKVINLLGNQAGVDARGRFVGAPPASETVVNPVANRPLEIQSNAGSLVINGFSFLGSNTGATGVIEVTTGATPGLQLLNNYVAVVTGANSSALFMNKSAIDATFNQNVFLASPTSSQSVIFDGADAFHGLQFTNNQVLRSSGVSGTGFFVDGNFNVSNVGSVNTPLIKGNLLQGFATGMNLGSRSFANGEISENVFTGNSANGLQGGPKHTDILRNTFDNTGTGIAFTSFGNTNADRGAQFNTVSENTFLNNATRDLFLSSTQGAGTISTNTIFGNSFGSATAIDYNEAVVAEQEFINASGNWWGNANGPTTANHPIGAGGAFTGAAAGKIDFTPWLNVGTDTAGGTVGFQGDFSVLNVDDDSPQTGAMGRIEEGVDRVTAGTVRVFNGTYTENFVTAKSAVIDLLGVAILQSPIAVGITGTFRLNGVHLSMNPVGPSTVNVTGDFQFAVGAIFDVRLNGLANFDKLNVAGSMTVTGAALSATRSFSPTVGTQFKF